ncbi:MAG: hypothetical protein PF447_01815 [Spirochaetaceae bacterium]|nr:hypothetical protein [Spirochaetaceae bacterium]
MKYGFYIILMLTIFYSCKGKENSLSLYLDNAEIQYETEFQRALIIKALNDTIELSIEELKNKRYPDYQNNENQWDLTGVIYRYFVPDESSKTLGEDFYHEAKTGIVQRRIALIISEIENK